MRNPDLTLGKRWNRCKQWKLRAIEAFLLHTDIAIIMKAVDKATNDYLSVRKLKNKTRNVMRMWFKLHASSHQQCVPTSRFKQEHVWSNASHYDFRSHFLQWILIGQLQCIVQKAAAFGNKEKVKKHEAQVCDLCMTDVRLFLRLRT